MQFVCYNKLYFAAINWERCKVFEIMFKNILIFQFSKKKKTKLTLQTQILQYIWYKITETNLYILE